MKNQVDYLKDISEMRSMMERSSRFISLSGLSGVFAGVYALIGAFVAQQILQSDQKWESRSQFLPGFSETTWLLILDAVVVLVLAIGTGIYFTTRNARKNGQKILDRTSLRMIINLLIPLGTGGCFTLLLLYWDVNFLVAPATLVFYGLALINGSKYTLGDIRYLGVLQIILGLVSGMVPGYSLAFWAFGFGVLHIVYGTVMYFKYEKGN